MQHVMYFCVQDPTQESQLRRRHAAAAERHAVLLRHAASADAAAVAIRAVMPRCYERRARRRHAAVVARAPLSRAIARAAAPHTAVIDAHDYMSSSSPPTEEGAITAVAEARRDVAPRYNSSECPSRRC